MDAGQVEAAATVASAVIATGALLFAGHANRRAKQANDAAQVANTIAADALRESRVANQLAEQANELSEEANAVAGRLAAQQSEEWLVDWVPEWEKEGCILRLVNTGGDVAHQVGVVVQAEGLHEVYGPLGDVEPGGQVEVALQQVGEERDRHAAKVAEELRGFRNAGWGTMPVAMLWYIAARVTVRWSTGSGRQVSVEIEQTLT